jgi:hypothetical protein
LDQDIRQQRWGDWDAVFDRVANGLSEQTLRLRVTASSHSTDTMSDKGMRPTSVATTVGGSTTDRP